MSAQMHRQLIVGCLGDGAPRRRKPDDRFRGFDSSPEAIRLAVMHVHYLNQQQRARP